jgi:predicted ribosomally synthesized peptide with nif11-like leader
MSNDLFAKIKSDSEFAKRIGGAKSLEEAFEIATSAGIPITMDELKSLNANPGAVSLDDTELERVAGGATYTYESDCATCKSDDQSCWS